MTFNQDEFIKVARLRNHSDKFIADTLEYANTLASRNLPVIFSLKHFSLILNVEYGELSKILLTRNYLYKFYKIKKKNNKGFRQIVVPYSNLRYIQDFIKKEILDKIPIIENATGFIKKKSILDNARVHQGQEEIINIDLFKFFDSITQKRVYEIFRSLGYTKSLSWDFAKLTTINLPQEYFETFKVDELMLYNKIVKKGESVLPQGAPTSPILSNLVAKRLDIRLSALAKKRGLSYSRYADDITFSGKYNSLPSIKLLYKIVEDEGFRVNVKKIRKSKKGRLQMVTSLTVSDGVHVHRDFKKVVKKHIYGCLNFGVEEHLKHIEKENIGFYKEWLQGKIYFINSIEPDYAKKLFEDFNKIVWEI